jgi:hypothetical protein
MDCVTCRDRLAHSVEGCPAATTWAGPPGSLRRPLESLIRRRWPIRLRGCGWEQAVVGGEAAGVGEAPAGRDPGHGVADAIGVARCQELPELAVALERATAEEPGLLDLPAAVGG